MNIFTYSYSPNPDTNMLNNITPELAAALVAAINEAGTSVVADAQNPFHKNSYATLGAHLTATKAVFAKHGLAIVQFPHGDGNQVGVNTMVIHKDGGYIQNYVTLPVGETVKGQDAGSLFSYLRRYAIAAVAGLATTDDDAEADRIVRTAAPAPAAKAAAAVAGARAMLKAAPAAAAPAGDIDPSMVLPFGRSKGLQIGELGVEDLAYWANTWEPRPFEKTGRVSEKDLKLKRTALALYANATGASSAPAADAPGDDVPF
jgi:hypothetical protein